MPPNRGTVAPVSPRPDRCVSSTSRPRCGVSRRQGTNQIRAEIHAKDSACDLRVPPGLVPGHGRYRDRSRRGRGAPAVSRMNRAGGKAPGRLGCWTSKTRRRRRRRPRPGRGHCEGDPTPASSRATTSPPDDHRRLPPDPLQLHEHSMPASAQAAANPAVHLVDAETDDRIAGFRRAGRRAGRRPGSSSSGGR